MSGAASLSLSCNEEKAKETVDDGELHGGSAEMAVTRYGVNVESVVSLMKEITVRHDGCALRALYAMLAPPLEDAVATAVVL